MFSEKPGTADNFEKTCSLLVICFHLEYRMQKAVKGNGLGTVRDTGGLALNSDFFSS